MNKAFEPVCRGDGCYRVSLAPGALFDLVQIGEVPAHGKCYQVVAERPEPCRECPLLGDDPTRPRVQEPLEADGPFRVVTALIEGPGEAQLTVRHIPQDVVSELVRARIRTTVKDAGLSPREREVLDAMLLGRPNDAVANLLGISVRTVKFHQSRLLAKLGADSRLDLLRLFL